MCLLRRVMFSMCIIIFQFTQVQDSKAAHTNADSEEGFVDNSGVKIWYKIDDLGSHNTLPIILVHGGPGATARPFEKSIGPLIAKDRKVIYMDYRGAGRSDRLKEKKHYSLDILADDMEAIRTHLKIKKWIVFGHSIGAATGTTYALRFPQRVAALVLCAPLVDSADLEMNMVNKVVFAPEVSYKNAKRAYNSDLGREGRFNKLLQLVDSRVRHELQFYNNDHADRLTDIQSELQREIGKKLMEGALVKGLFANGLFEFNAFESADKLSMPTLLLLGRFDSEISIENSMKFALAIPDGYVALLNKSGHHPYLEESRLTAEKVKLFLSKQVEVYQQTD